MSISSLTRDWKISYPPGRQSYGTPQNRHKNILIRRCGWIFFSSQIAKLFEDVCIYRQGLPERVSKVKRFSWTLNFTTNDFLSFFEMIISDKFTLLRSQVRNHHPVASWEADALSVLSGPGRRLEAELRPLNVDPYFKITRKDTRNCQGRK